MTKNDFINTYFDLSKQLELIDKFGLVSDSIDLESIINDCYNEALDAYTDSDGIIDEDNFNFGDFDDDLEYLIKEKLTSFNN